MLKDLKQLEHKIADKAYHFICDPSSPLNEVKESLYKFLGYVDNIEQAAKAQQEAQKAAEPIVSDKVEPIIPPVESPQPDPIDELKQMLEGNEHV